MLFLAVVKDFDFFAKMKIQFKRGMVHSICKISLAFLEQTEGDVEQRIWDKIFNKFHDPFVRPIRKREDKLVVRVGITYHQLIDVVSRKYTE